MANCRVLIKGMHCRSCEILISESLAKVSNVQRVKVNHKKGMADITYQNSLDMKEVEKAVQNAGYELLEGEKQQTELISKNRLDYQQLLMALGISLVLFFLVKIIGISEWINLSGSNYGNLGVVFLVGLTAGVSTCMALVGGLVLGLAAKFSAQNSQSTSFNKFRPHLFFNLGRITGFLILGGVIGWFGNIFQLSSITLGVLTILMALLMILVGAQLLGIFPRLNTLSLTLPSSLYEKLHIKNLTEKGYTTRNAVLLGALTFFLPCGFTQSMQLYAISTANPLNGALTMAVFAIGTTPGLLGVGAVVSFIKGKWSGILFKTVGVIVIALALFNLQGGMNLLGTNPLGWPGGFSESQLDTDPNVRIVDGIQEVRMTQTGTGYFPNKFIIQKDIPVRWIITSQNIYSCASSIYSAPLKINQLLELGENVIEFTPKNTGTIRFSCSMGMYTGSFNVVDGKKGNPGR